MKTLSLALLLITATISGYASAAKQLPPFHLDLNASSEEYTALLAQRTKLVGLKSPAQEELQKVLDLGKRNLDWLQFMNAKRPADQKFSFSSAATQIGYPIEQPKEYNEYSVFLDYVAIKKDLPGEMYEVLFHSASFTETPPIDEQSYLTWGRKIDRVYQTAARWILLEPYLDSYTRNRSADIRGYYYLQKEVNLENQLRNFAQVPEDKKQRFRTWLVGMCMNKDARSSDDCSAELRSNENAKRVWNFYSKYLPVAKKVYDDFFRIQSSRRDFTWDANNPNLFSVPFIDPKNQPILSFLKDNIEQEWQWSSWRLRLNFLQNSAGDHPHVRFEPGVTPHVEGIAGSTIVMDANAPLTEYDVQWTIRHEFGHVLGFPDCYIEFYDENRGVMVSYQIDITNLMCSRRGHLQERHYSELKRVYFKNRK